jgi:Na+-driven multidrug efflux pump
VITMGMGLSPLKDGGVGGMWNPAIGYLRIRALGTPAATLWLVTNGIFRGLGDTQTPLRYALAFTVLNIILDPLFMFGPLKWGAAGAAAGTAIAQYVALIPLLLALHNKVRIDVFGQVGELKQSLRQYISAGSIVLIRTVGKVLAYSVCARQAALLGSVAAAAYNLTFQLGFATTQICEAVAVAVQTLLARELSVDSSLSPHGEDRKASLVRHLINTSLWLGGGVATALSLGTYWHRDWILSGLTTNVAIRSASAAIFPVVLLTQILKGFAYPVNGIIMGGLDWVYSMVAMWIANFVCVGMVYNFASRNVSGVATLGQLWWALAAFMGVQVVAGIIRYESKTGIWKVLRTHQKKENDFILN